MKPKTLNGKSETSANMKVVTPKPSHQSKKLGPNGYKRIKK